MRDASPSTLKIVYDFTAYVARRLTQLPNAKLHDFRAIREVRAIHVFLAVAAKDADARHRRQVYAV